MQSRATQIIAKLDADTKKKNKISKFIGTAAKIMNVVNVCFPNPWTMGAAVVLNVANSVYNQKPGSDAFDKISGIVKACESLTASGPNINSKIDAISDKIFKAKWDGNPVT